MSAGALLVRLAETAPVPDRLLEIGIARRVARTRRRLAGLDGAAVEARFVAAMAGKPVAEHVAAANAQHYELPAEFFSLVLGPRRKYSCCFYEREGDTLAQAEEQALAATAARAQLADGQAILELGCGWGSLSLWMAEHFPNADITAVSNSGTQRAFIEEQARVRGLGNLRVITADMNDFVPGRAFDRIVSVEMLEHMANWTAVLARAASWLNRDGRMFVHVFSHRAVPYRFHHDDGNDWIARHFFTGGIMPSRGLIHHTAGTLALEEEWHWSGAHYRRTARDWLANFDARRRDVRAILERVYGREAAVWMRRWRLFFLATAGLFGDCDGAEWGVSHYRLKLR